MDGGSHWSKDGIQDDNHVIPLSWKERRVLNTVGSTAILKLATFINVQYCQ